MYRLEKTRREDHRFQGDSKNPSFSSSLLDEIYRSIDEGERKTGEVKFYRETMAKKQSVRSNSKCNRGVEEDEVTLANLRRACLLEKWMDKKVISEKVGRQQPTEIDRKLQHHDHDHDHDQDVLFFSSTSISSDSSSGGLSSSDTESMYGVKPRASCFAPPRPKPVKTTMSVKSDRSEKKQRRLSALFHEQKEVHLLDDYHHSSTTGRMENHEESLIKSKSRALRIYNNLKKVKQPISPGGRLTSFLNSLFTAGNTKKTKPTSSVGGYEDLNAERKYKSGQASTCSSASSFSRSCLSKTSPSSREKLRNGDKRTVRFYPVSVIVDEDSRPCGHKCLYKEEDDSSLMPVSVTSAWKIGRSLTKKNDEEIKFPIMEKSKRVEEAAREFLKEYHQNQKKSDSVLRDLTMRGNANEDDDDDEDDDAASCASSDLFELDHLAVIGNGRYCEELPVYETTHVNTNRAIANGLIM